MCHCIRSIFGVLGIYNFDRYPNFPPIPYKYRYRNSVDTTLRGKRINNFVKLWCLVASGQPANANETQMSKPPDANKHHNSTKLLSLLLLRAIYFSRFQYETPCVIIYPVTSFFTLVTPSQASYAR